jgi:hypothetical protein
MEILLLQNLLALKSIKVNYLTFMSFAPACVDLHACYLF